MYANIMEVMSFDVLKLFLHWAYLTSVSNANGNCANLWGYTQIFNVCRIRRKVFVKVKWLIDL